eukprot:UN01049
MTKAQRDAYAYIRFCILFCLFREFESADRCFVEYLPQGKTAWTLVPTVQPFSIIWDASDSESSEFGTFDLTSDHQSRPTAQVVLRKFFRLVECVCSIHRFSG